MDHSMLHDSVGFLLVGPIAAQGANDGFNGEETIRWRGLTYRKTSTQEPPLKRAPKNSALYL